MNRLPMRRGKYLPVWRRSVRIDADGLAWTYAGIRADVIYLAFIMGMSIDDLCENVVDGMALPRQSVEDVIRWGQANWKRSETASPSRTDPPTKKR